MKSWAWLILVLTAAIWAAAPAPQENNQPPLPPLGGPPMQIFRDLLNTNAAGREAFLSSRSPEQRRLIEQKLAEYESLPPTQRELRLTLTDLRHYLMIFLHLPSQWRGTYLAQLPAGYRPLVAERLKAWDRLDENTRRDLLQNEDLLAYLVRLESAPPTPEGLFLSQLPPERRQSMETALKMWSQTTPQHRQMMMQRFKQFFQLSETEQRVVIGSLPPDQRQAHERLLAALSRLSPEQREKYTAAVNRFLGLAPAEQEQFLRNALTWQRLTPEQRQMVREMVSKVPPLPPLPPGLLQSTGPSLGGTGSATSQR